MRRNLAAHFAMERFVARFVVFLAACGSRFSSLKTAF
jgi:hypothetical protein